MLTQRRWLPLWTLATPIGLRRPYFGTAIAVSVPAPVLAATTTSPRRLRMPGLGAALLLHGRADEAIRLGFLEEIAMGLLMPRYRPWTIVAEAVLVVPLFVGLAVSHFSEHHPAIGWVCVVGAGVILISAANKWRKERRRSRAQRPRAKGGIIVSRGSRSLSA